MPTINGGWLYMKSARKTYKTRTLTQKTLKLIRRVDFVSFAKFWADQSRVFDLRKSQLKLMNCERANNQFSTWECWQICWQNYERWFLNNIRESPNKKWPFGVHISTRCMLLEKNVMKLLKLWSSIFYGSMKCLNTIWPVCVCMCHCKDGALSMSDGTA